MRVAIIVLSTVLTSTVALTGSPSASAQAAPPAAGASAPVTPPDAGAARYAAGDPSAPSVPGAPLDAPDPLEEGTPRSPSKTAPAPPRARTAVVPTTTSLTFHTAGYRPVAVPNLYQPWRARTVPRVDDVVHDAQGVRMFEWNGKVWNHPVGQAQYGLQNLNTYRVTGDVFYLDRARAQADRLINTRVEARGAWYFPYQFDFTLGGHPGVAFTAPWYSGMAQGETTGLFAQLAQVSRLTDTQRAQYRQAADGAFASLTLGSDAKPWTVHTDPDGYLWLQEYPVDPEANSDFTYNGHLFSALGVWDYARLTGSQLAADIFDGAITTAVHYAPNIRNVNWYSSYCVRHKVPHRNYHMAHISLMLQMHWLTSRPEPAKISDTFVADYPPYLVTGPVVFAGTTHTLYKFTDTGAISASKKVTFSRATSAGGDQRIRIKGRGIHYRVSNGTLAGWYVPEVFGRSFMRGQYIIADYLPDRLAVFPAGRTMSVYRFDSAGNVLGSKTVSFARDSSAPFNRRAVINGRTYVRITAGGLTGYWVPVSVVQLDG